MEMKQTCRVNVLTFFTQRMMRKKQGPGASKTSHTFGLESIQAESFSRSWERGCRDWNFPTCLFTPFTFHSPFLNHFPACMLTGRRLDRLPRRHDNPCSNGQTTNFKTQSWIHQSHTQLTSTFGFEKRKFGRLYSLFWRVFRLREGRSCWNADNYGAMIEYLMLVSSMPGCRV